jgi:hypothetical protein
MVEQSHESGCRAIRRFRRSLNVGTGGYGFTVDRRKRVLNLRESAVDRMLANYANENGYRVSLKMRLRDVIDVDDLPLDARERNFSFTSHLDFVAFDTETHLPVLAVEYDGPQHLTDHRQIERDRLKDELCKAAELPLLRIDNLFTRKEGRWKVLTYILWAHEMGKSFYAARGSGQILDDEGFDAGTLLLPTQDGRGYEFSALAGPALTYLHGFRVRQNVEWEARWWRPTDVQVETRMLMSLPNGQYLFAQCAIRDFAIEGISALEISEELATAELGWLAKQYDEGDAVAINAEQGQRVLDEIGKRAGRSEMRTASGWRLSYSYGRGDDFDRPRAD